MLNFFHRLLLLIELYFLTYYLLNFQKRLLIILFKLNVSRQWNDKIGGKTNFLQFIIFQYNKKIKKTLATTFSTHSHLSLCQSPTATFFWEITVTVISKGSFTGNIFEESIFCHLWLHFHQGLAHKKKKISSYMYHPTFPS